MILENCILYSCHCHKFIFHIVSLAKNWEIKKKLINHKEVELLFRLKPHWFCLPYETVSAQFRFCHFGGKWNLFCEQYMLFNEAFHRDTTFRHSNDLRHTPYII